MVEHHAMKIKKWRYIVIFTLLLLYSREKGSWYPMDSKLGGNQSQPGCSLIYINKIIKGCQFFSSSVTDESDKDKGCSSWRDHPWKFNFAAMRIHLRQSQFVSP
jgi:hypothetical protein